MYEYETRGNYGAGYETVFTDSNRLDGLCTLHSYETNDKKHPYKLVRVKR